MTTYQINRTRSSINAISVPSEDINTNFDITLFGRERLSYGEELNENLVGLLENFSCPENTSNPGNPDLSVSIDNKLSNPLEGQLWYNSTQKMLFVWELDKWVPLSAYGDIAGNWGVIAHGEQLPQPINPRTGVPIPYANCAWIVSPFNYPDRIDWTVCSANDPNAIVRSQYRVANSGIITNGFANYMIVGIRHNQNIGEVLPDIDTPSLLLGVQITGEENAFCSIIPECQASTFLTAEPNGGNAGYLTYAWSSPDPLITFFNATSQTCLAIGPLISTFTDYIATIEVEVTDTLTSTTVTDSIVVTFQAITEGLPA